MTMTTITESTPQHELQRLLKDRRLLAAGSLWGFLVLLLFGFWFGARDQGALSVDAFVLSAVAVAMAARLFFATGGPGEAEQRLARIPPEPRTFTLILARAGSFLSLLVPPPHHPPAH